jgi:hypothetical protein
MYEKAKNSLLEDFDKEVKALREKLDAAARESISQVRQDFNIMMDNNSAAGDRKGERVRERAGKKAVQKKTLEGLTTLSVAWIEGRDVSELGEPTLPDFIDADDPPMTPRRISRTMTSLSSIRTHTTVPDIFSGFRLPPAGER